MGVVAGLVLGAGLCLLLWALTSEPPGRRVRGGRPDRLTDVLLQAGVTGVSAGGLVGASVLAGLGDGVARFQALDLAAQVRRHLRAEVIGQCQEHLGPQSL